MDEQLLEELTLLLLPVGRIIRRRSRRWRVMSAATRKQLRRPISWVLGKLRAQRCRNKSSPKLPQESTSSVYIDRQL